MTAPQSRAWREIRPFIGPAAVLVVYALVRFAYIALSQGDGVLAPTGDVDGLLAGLAFATFVLRLLALVVVPFVVVYRAVDRLCVRALRPLRRPPST